MTLPACTNEPGAYYTADGYAPVWGDTPDLLCAASAAQYAAVTGNPVACVSIHGHGVGTFELSYTWLSYTKICDPDAVDPGTGSGSSGTAFQITGVDGNVTVTFAQGTQTVVVAPQEFSAEQMADMGVAFGFMLLLCFIAFGGKQLLNLFKTDSVRD